MHDLTAVHQLTDEVIVETVLQFAKNERHDHTGLLVFLGELDERKLFLERGHSSMWSYCRRTLKFSESVTQHRIVVAKAARKFPAILEMLRTGALSLCTAADLAPRFD